MIWPAFCQQGYEGIMAAERIGNNWNYSLELFHSSELSQQLWGGCFISALARVLKYSSVLSYAGPLNKSYSSKTFLILQDISVTLHVWSSYPRKLVFLSTRESVQP